MWLFWRRVIEVIAPESHKQESHWVVQFQNYPQSSLKSRLIHLVLKYQSKSSYTPPICSISIFNGLTFSLWSFYLYVHPSLAYFPGPSWYSARSELNIALYFFFFLYSLYSLSDCSHIEAFTFIHSYFHHLLSGLFIQCLVYLPHLIIKRNSGTLQRKHVSGGLH